jgi:hypothetical protein
VEVILSLRIKEIKFIIKMTLLTIEEQVAEILNIQLTKQTTRNSMKVTISKMVKKVLQLTIWNIKTIRNAILNSMKIQMKLIILNKKKSCKTKK